jgi:hypothetical protein
MPRTKQPQAFAIASNYTEMDINGDVMIFKSKCKISPKATRAAPKEFKLPSIQSDLFTIASTEGGGALS